MTKSRTHDAHTRAVLRKAVRRAANTRSTVKGQPMKGAGLCCMMDRMDWFYKKRGGGAATNMARRSILKKRGTYAERQKRPPDRAGGRCKYGIRSPSRCGHRAAFILIFCICDGVGQAAKLRNGIVLPSVCMERLTRSRTPPLWIFSPFPPVVLQNIWTPPAACAASFTTAL